MSVLDYFVIQSGGKLLKNLSIFFQKMRKVFLAQTLQASLGFGHKKNLPAKLKGFWSESIPVFRTY